MAKDVKIRSTLIRLNTGTGTQDLTISGFGTVKAARLVAVNSAGASTDNMIMSIGYTDKTNHRCGAYISTDSGDKTVTKRGSVQGGDLIVLLDESSPTTAKISCSYSASITNGIRISIDTNDDSRPFFLVKFYGGADLEAVVGDITSSSSVGGTATVSGLSFAPEVVEAFGTDDPFSDPISVVNHAIVSMGFAAKGSSQKSICSYHRHNRSTPETSMWVSSNRLLCRMSFNDPNERVELTSWDSGGFVLTTRDTASSMYVGYLAYNIAGLDAKVGSVTTPGTFDSAETGFGLSLGHIPQSVDLLTSCMLAEDTGYKTANDAASGLGIGGITKKAAGTGEFDASVYVSDEDASTSGGNTTSFIAASISTRDKVGGSEAVANIVRFEYETFVLDFTSKGAGDFVWPYLSIEDPNSIRGTSTGTSSASATLKVLVELAGTSTGTSSASATLKGTGELAGTSTGTSSASTTLKGTGELVGTSTGTSSGSATLKGTGTLAGTATGIASSGTTLTATGSLAGSTTGTSSSSATLGGKVFAVGTITGTSSASGTLLAVGILVGTIAGSNSASGTVEAVGQLVGTITGTSSAIGTLAQDQIMGTSTGTSSASGTLVGTGELQGASTGAASSTVTLKGVAVLEGTATGESSGITTLKGTGNLEGTIVSSSSANASPVPQSLQGTAFGSSVPLATLTAVGELQGSALGISSASATASHDGIAGTATGTSNVVGTLVAVGALTGTIIGTSSASATAFTVGIATNRGRVQTVLHSSAS